MPRQKRRSISSRYGGVADLIYDSNTDWYYPKPIDFTKIRKYGDGEEEKTYWQGFKSLLGFRGPTRANKKQWDETGYMPVRYERMVRMPDPLKLIDTKATSGSRHKKMKSLNLPRL